MNHFNIPLLWPFKMVPSTSTPNITSDFDGAWWCEQRKSFERQVSYKQKWKKSDTTKLQIESSIAPESFKMYRPDGSIAKSFNWTAAYTGISYVIYETTVDMSDQAEGVYIPFLRVAGGSIDWKAIGEPVHIKSSWPDTLLFTYSNSYNDQGMAWTTGIEMKFRCEAGIMDFEPGRDRAAYVNQTRNVFNLSGVPYRVFKLYIGKAPGVAPWVVDLLNRIFCCDDIDIDGVKYQSDDGSKWEVNRVKGFPLVGASIDIVPAQNVSSKQFADTTPVAPGILIAYQMDTNFFGPGSRVPVIDVDPV